jgi:geranylgeranyl reductase family protein
MAYDVIVVGSGPGGATAASILAARGKSVLLVDRQAFPRDKVCGDGLPQNVMRLMINQLGIDPGKTGLKYQRIYGLSIGAPSGRALIVEERGRAQFSMASPRLDFDMFLHEHAVRAGATFEVMNVEGPLLVKTAKGGERIAGIIERRGKETIEHEARVVIAADGAASPVARGVRGRVADPAETAIAIRAYGRLTRPMPFYVYFKYKLNLVPGYAWIFPVAEDRANIGLGLFDQGAYKRRGQSLKLLLDQFIQELQAEYPLEVEPDSIKSWPLPLWVSSESRVVKGAYLVGDAGRFIDALSGGGIYPAMVTGQLAAQSAIHELEGMDSVEAAALYDVGWRNGIARKLRKAKLVQDYIASQPRVFNMLFSLATIHPTIKRTLLTSLAGEHS